MRFPSNHQYTSFERLGIALSNIHDLGRINFGAKICRSAIKSSRIPCNKSTGNY